MEEPKKCWERNPGCGEGAEKCNDCPAFRAGKSCWEFNWKPIASLCDDKLKPYWEVFVEKICILMNCPNYEKHKREVDEIIELFEHCHDF